MIYIKLDQMMNLTITRNGPVHRGDNLFQTLIFLIPVRLNGIDVRNTDVTLSYIRQDGTADIVALEQMDEMYNDDYCQYSLPVTTDITKYAGKIRAWLVIVEKAFEAEDSVIAKSDECVIHVTDSEDLTSLFDEEKTEALFQIRIDGGWIVAVYDGEKGDLEYIVDGGVVE